MVFCKNILSKKFLLLPSVNLREFQIETLNSLLYSDNQVAVLGSRVLIKTLDQALLSERSLVSVNASVHTKRGLVIVVHMKSIKFINKNVMLLVLPQCSIKSDRILQLKR